MSHFYYVGLDISKDKHDGYIINEQGEVINDNFTFPNNLDGFEYFRNILYSLNELKGNIKIGLESTGHYGRNLKKYLLQYEYQYMEMNPSLTASFQKALIIGKFKTDKIDTNIIIKTMIAIGYKAHKESKPEYDELKVLYRERLILIDEKSKYKVKVVNFYDKVFPELNKIIGVNSVTARYLFKKYPNPKNILKVDREQLFNDLYKVSRYTFNKTKFDALIKAATNTIGHYSNASHLSAKMAIKNIDRIEDDIKLYDKEIDKILKKINSPLKSMKGIGNATIAAIYAEYGAMENFSTVDQAIKFSGIIPNQSQSGKSQHFGKMAKCGSHALRNAIMRAMAPLRNSQPVFKSLYDKKKQEGKHHLVAISHMAKKFLRIVFHLIKTNTEFDLSALK